jgi:hypothetical protein
MNINRHNYEDFFLLYVDNELNAAQRKAVEDFVAEHTDLKAELNLLQQATLMPEPLTFEGKASLMQHPAELVTLANCQTYFLNYIDNELSAEERAATEKFILQHPDVQPAFDSLKSAVLPIENIVFDDKESLYRQEQKVIPFRWWRMAAAAVVIGLGITVWMVIPNNNLPSGSEVATKSNFVNKPSSNDEQITTNDDVVTAGDNTPSSDVNTSASIPAAQSVYQTANKADAMQPTKSVIAKNDNTISPAVVIDIPVTTPIKTTTTDRKADVAVLPKPDKADKIEKTNDVVQYTAVSADAENTTAVVQPAVYRTLDTEDEEKNIVYIGGAQISKQKLRGLFKTVTKMFEKPGKNKTNNSDNTTEEDNNK